MVKAEDHAYCVNTHFKVRLINIWRSSMCGLIRLYPSFDGKCSFHRGTLNWPFDCHNRVSRLVCSWTPVTWHWPSKTSPFSFKENIVWRGVGTISSFITNFHITWLDNGCVKANVCNIRPYTTYPPFSNELQSGRVCWISWPLPSLYKQLLGSMVKAEDHAYCVTTHFKVRLINIWRPSLGGLIRSYPWADGRTDRQTDLYIFSSSSFIQACNLIMPFKYMLKKVKRKKTNTITQNKQNSSTNKTNEHGWYIHFSHFS